MAIAIATLPQVFTTVERAEQCARAFTSRLTEFVFFDTETSGLDPRSDKLAAILLKQGDRQAFIFDVRDRPELVKALSPIFEQCLLVGHNLKFDLNWLRTYGIRCIRPGKAGLYDTQIAEQLIHGVGLSEASDSGFGVNLQATAERYGIAVSKEERHWFYEPGPLHTRPEWNEPFPDEQLAYMSQDVDVLGPIMQAQMPEMKRLKLNAVMKLEMRTLPALVEMESAGIRIDVDGWRAFIAEKDAEAKRLEGETLAIIGSAILNRRIDEYDQAVDEWRQARGDLQRFEEAARMAWDQHHEADEPWGVYKSNVMKVYREQHVIPARPKLDLEQPNLDSQRQLISGMEALGIPVPTKKNLKTGERVPTTEDKALEAIEGQYPVVKLLRTYRKARKFVTSFGEKLLERVGPDGRIHPDYQQIGASTGRMSCQRPNWQQVPSKGDGKKLRELVKASAGCDMLTADFSNIELRILANITGDPVMIDAFERGLDLHSETARRMFKLGPDADPKHDVWKRDLTYRAIAKIINFMLVYGGTPFKLAMDIGITTDEAEALVESYFEAYQGVARWMDETKKLGQRNLVAVTLAGRRRPFDDPGREPEMYFSGFKDPAKNRAAYQQYEERLRDWKKARARVARQALNTPIQGTSADITKLALAIFCERIDHRYARLVACVHDELVVEVKQSYTAEAVGILRAAMKEACDTYLTVSPVPAPDVSISDHWVKD